MSRESPTPHLQLPLRSANLSSAAPAWGPMAPALPFWSQHEHTAPRLLAVHTSATASHSHSRSRPRVSSSPSLELIVSQAGASGSRQHLTRNQAQINLSVMLC